MIAFSVNATRIPFLGTFRVGIILFFCSIFLFPLLSRAGDRETDFLLYKVVSIDCQYEPVNNVLNDISRQSGLGITYDQILEDDTIIASIGFIDELYAIDAVIRLLRGKNTVIEYSEDLNNINIVTFDQIN